MIKLTLNVVIALSVECLIVLDSFLFERFDFSLALEGIVADFSASHLEAIINEDVAERNENQHEVGRRFAIGVCKFTVEVCGCFL